MKYTVIWLPAAEQQLAALWLDPVERSAVTQAANTIDQKLQAHPEQQGESRPNGRRILFKAPLGVLFRVYPQDAIVRVLEVWRFKRHGQPP